jgi:HEAT repeat protein
MPRQNILALLRGGDRRSIGRADQVVAIVSKNPALFSELIAGLRNEDLLVRMRAADAAEKISRTTPALLQLHKDELLALMGETRQQELQWHLAAMVPRLSLSAAERQSAAFLLNRYLEAPSSIVKTSALQGLADLVHNDPAIRETAITALRNAMQNGTPAMKARSRKLLHHLERI